MSIPKRNACSRARVLRSQTRVFIDSNTGFWRSRKRFFTIVNPQTCFSLAEQSFLSIKAGSYGCKTRLRQTILLLLLRFNLVLRRHTLGNINIFKRQASLKHSAVMVLKTWTKFKILYSVCHFPVKKLLNDMKIFSLLFCPELAQYPKQAKFINEQS